MSSRAMRFFHTKICFPFWREKKNLPLKLVKKKVAAENNHKKMIVSLSEKSVCFNYLFKKNLPPGLLKITFSLCGITNFFYLLSEMCKKKHLPLRKTHSPPPKFYWFAPKLENTLWVIIEDFSLASASCFCYDTICARDACAWPRSQVSPFVKRAPEVCSMHMGIICPIPQSIILILMSGWL